MNRKFTNLELYAEKRLKAVNKEKATEESKALAMYYGKLYDMIAELNDNLVDGLTKDWGQTGLRAIIIGQELSGFWKTGGKNFNKSFGGLAVNSAHRSLSGRLQANEDTFQMTKSQALLADQTGVFCYSASSPSPCDSAGASAIEMKMSKESKFIQFRSFFSLIENDFNYEEFEAEGPDAYVTNHGKRFTTQLLANYLDKGDMVINQVVEELYDADNGCNRDEVSFAGLLKVMQQKAGISDETLIANMNRGYEVFDGIFRQLGLTQYANLEEYLCDCSPDSLFSLNELMAMLGFGGTAPKRKVASDVDMEEEISVFSDNVVDAEGYAETDMPKDYKQPIHQQQSQQTANPTQAHSGPIPQPQTQSGQHQQQAARPQQTQPGTAIGSVKPKIHSNVYNKQLEIPNGKNPFRNYGGGEISTINQLKKMTEFILQDITSMVGGLDRVDIFGVTNEGILIINNTAYQPQFDTAFIDSLPFAIQGKVASGCVAELFDLSKVYQFKNLQSLIIDSQALAQGRARREIGLKPYERYNVLFKPFTQLRYINAGGVEYRKNMPDDLPEGDTLQGYGFKDRMKRLLPDLMAPSPAKSDSRMNDFWESKQMKLLTNAAGWTAATYGVYLGAVLLGPIGLLFGAFAMHGAYKNLKPQQQPSPQKNQQNERQSGNNGNKGSGNQRQNNQSRSNNSNNSRSM
jgi:hypothetical protein